MAVDMSNTVLGLVSVWMSEGALYDQCAIGILWLVLFLIFWKLVSWMLLFQHCCHFVWRSLLILGFRSVYGILKLSVVRSKAGFAAKSTLSFPLTPMWLGIEHIIIFLWLDIESSLLNCLIIRGFSSFYYLRIVKLRASLRIW